MREPHRVHLPANVNDILADRVVRGKERFTSLCGIPAKMPPRVKTWINPENGSVTLIVGPHPRYYAYCRACADHVESKGITLHNVEGNDAMGQR